MAKTLKDFLNERQLGPMVVKNPDEQKFIDKHVVAKTADRNGNDDEVFKGSKVKMADRKKDRKGYNPGEDEDVYEELKGAQHKIDANKNGKVDAHDFHLLRNRKKKVAEEAEELEELSKDTVRNYFNKGGEQGKKITDKMKMSGGDWTADGSATKTLRKRAAGRAMAYKRRTGEIKMSEDSEQIDETSNAYRDRFGPGGINDKKRAAMHMLTPDDTGSTAKARTPEEHKTRHNEFLNIASNKNTTLAQLGKMAAHSYKVYHDIKEDSEQINELSKKTLGSYVIKSLAPSSEKSVSNLASKGGYKLGQAHDDDYTAGEKEDAKSVKRSLGVLTAVRKMTKEQSELEEKLDMKKASMGTVVKDFQKSDAPQFMGKSQKKRQVMAIAAKLSAERGDKPLNKEERLLTKLADLAETHQRTMVSVFEKLNEDNQYAFMQACDTADGIEQMLDFSISYRGE